jgi:hypothetical protein
MKSSPGWENPIRGWPFFGGSGVGGVGRVTRVWAEFGVGYIGAGFNESAAASV